MKTFAKIIRTVSFVAMLALCALFYMELVLGMELGRGLRFASDALLLFTAYFALPFMGALLVLRCLRCMSRFAWGEPVNAGRD